MSWMSRRQSFWSDKEEDGTVRGALKRKHPKSRAPGENELLAKQAGQMFEDRVRGMTLREIAEKYEVSLATVRRRLATHMPEVLDKSVTKFRAVEMHKLDQLEDKVDEIIGKVHYTVSHGRVIYLEDPDTGLSIPLEDSAPILQAIQTKLRIAERRAKLLGLDRPYKAEVNVNKTVTPNDDSLKKLLEDLHQKQQREEAVLRGIESSEILEAEIVEDEVEDD